MTRRRKRARKQGVIDQVRGLIRAYYERWKHERK